MKKLYILLSCLLFISLISFGSCRSRNRKAEQNKVLEHPKPITDPGVDSLKNYLDQERERRKQQGKE